MGRASKRKARGKPPAGKPVFRIEEAVPPHLRVITLKLAESAGVTPYQAYTGLLLAIDEVMGDAVLVIEGKPELPADFRLDIEFLVPFPEDRPGVLRAKTLARPFAQSRFNSAMSNRKGGDAPPF